jgi:hypothetical protein
MAKAQGKKAAPAGNKGAAKKVASKLKRAVAVVKKKVVPKKASPAKAAPKKVAKPAPKPVKKPAGKVKAAAKAATKAVKKVAKAVAPKKVLKAAKAAAPVRPVPKAVKPATKTAPKAAPKAVLKPAPKATAKPAPVAKAAKAVSAAKPATAPKGAAPKPVAAAKPAPVVKAVTPAPPPPAAAAEPEKKRGRRARPRITSNGAPAAAWLSTEKPRPASFIPAPPRAEAPSAIAAPPASSDRLIRTEDLTETSIRTVPVRIDVEQAQGRFLVLPNPLSVAVRKGEAIEWDFRYIGGADFAVEEIVIEFVKAAPFGQPGYRTRKPGGARPHRQVSGPTAGVSGTYEYTITAMTPFKTSLATGKAQVVIPD